MKVDLETRTQSSSMPSTISELVLLGMNILKTALSDSGEVDVGMSACLRYIPTACVKIYVGRRCQ